MILTDMGEKLASELFSKIDETCQEFHSRNYTPPEPGDVIIDYMQIRGRMDVIEVVEFEGLWNYIEEERNKILTGETESIVMDYFNTISCFNEEKIVIQVGMHGQTTNFNQYLFNDVRKTLETYTPKTIRMLYESHSLLFPGSKTYVPPELLKYPMQKRNIIPLPPKEDGYFVHGYHPKYASSK